MPRHCSFLTDSASVFGKRSEVDNMAKCAFAHGSSLLLQASAGVIENQSRLLPIPSCALGELALFLGHNRIAVQPHEYSGR